MYLRYLIHMYPRHPGMNGACMYAIHPEFCLESVLNVYVYGFHGYMADGI